MRWGRTDANQAAIVAALRRCGASVVDLSGVGNGFPDLIVGRRTSLCASCGKNAGPSNLLIEVKDGSKPASARRLTEDQERFHASWKGRIWIVKSQQEIIDIMERRMV